MEPSNEQNPQQTLTPSEVNPPIEASKDNLLQRMKSNPMRVIQVLASALLILAVVAIGIRQSQHTNQNVSSTISNTPQLTITVTPISADTPTPTFTPQPTEDTSLNAEVKQNSTSVVIINNTAVD